MTAEGVAREFEEWWQARNSSNVASKNSHAMIDELFQLYAQLSDSQRALIDEVLSAWLASDNIAKRFDALALIGHFRIRACIPDLIRYKSSLGVMAGPEVPYEIAKVERILHHIEQEQMGSDGPERSNGPG